MAGSTDALENGVSLAVLVVVLAVVLEILANVPAVGIESNPLGFIFDWIGEATDNDSNSNDSGNGNGGLL